MSSSSTKSIFISSTPSPLPGPGIHNLDVHEPKAVQLAPVEKKKEEPVEVDGWRKVRVTYDTGAGASVAPKESFPGAKVVATSM